MCRSIEYCISDKIALTKSLYLFQSKSPWWQGRHAGIHRKKKDKRVTVLPIHRTRRQSWKCGKAKKPEGQPQPWTSSSKAPPPVIPITSPNNTSKEGPSNQMLNPAHPNLHTYALPSMEGSKVKEKKQQIHRVPILMGKVSKVQSSAPCRPWTDKIYMNTISEDDNFVCIHE